MYYKQFIMGVAESGKVSIMKVKETLTDSKGEFYFPSDTGLMPFFSTELFSAFIIYKPGYVSSSGPSGSFSRVLIEKFFSIDVIGKEGEIRDGYDSWKGPLGIVELTKGDGMSPSPPADYRSKALPLLFKAINEDRKRRGLEEDVK